MIPKTSAFVPANSILEKRSSESQPEGSAKKLKTEASDTHQKGTWTTRTPEEARAFCAEMEKESAAHFIKYPPLIHAPPPKMSDKQLEECKKFFL